MTNTTYNPLRALQRFVELRSAARRSLALDFARAPPKGAASEAPPEESDCICEAAEETGPKHPRAPADGLERLTAGASRPIRLGCCG